MALWVCAGPDGCGTKYAVGLFRCPRCHNTEFFEDGDPMAKITRHSGASDKTLPAQQEVRLQPGEYVLSASAVKAVVEGGEESSPGTSSSTSTETQPPKSEPSSKSRRKPARTTASPSAPDLTESSSASSTAGEKTTATSATDSASD